MPQTGAIILIEDEAAPDLFLSLLEMEIDEDHRMASSFRIKVSISRQNDGVWTLLEDERLKLWAKIKISVTLADEETEIITGYVTQINPHIAVEESGSYVEIWGMDASCLMSLEEKARAWPNMSDSDVASQIFTEYNLAPEVEDTGVVHDETIGTIIQRDTDIRFLQRLARRNGYECFVNGETGFFRKPVLDAEPLPYLAAHFGAETNLISFEAKLNSLRPTKVEMHQLDIVEKETLDATADAGEQTSLGRDRAESVAAPNGVVPRVFVRQAVTVNQPEMDNFCRAIFDESEWLIEANGELNSSQYGGLLRAKSLVPIKGVGELFSGTYYITNVKHSFHSETYTQHFRAKRNALAPSGTEDFGGGGSLLGGL